MKRILSAMLVFALALALCGCGAGETAAPATTENAAYAESLVAVENIAYQLQEQKWELKEFNVKIRNVTDQVLNEITFKGQGLDANGDVLEEWIVCSVDALEPGQASWARVYNNDLFRGCKSIEEAAQRAETIRITSMHYRADMDAAEDWMGWEDYDFREPPTFKVADILPEGEDVNIMTQPDDSREIGPESWEGKTMTIRDVSVDFAEELPGDIVAFVAYNSVPEKDYELSEGKVYAVVSFTVTNQHTEEINLSTVADKFIVELVYDGGFTYATSDDVTNFYRSGSQYAMKNDGFGLDKIVIAPLMTEEVTVYVPCARAVADNTDKILDVNFLSLYSGHEKMSFAIR